MCYRAFPCANPFLDMKEKRNAYLRHIKALRTPRHIVDDTQPETPNRLVTRKNRYIEMQRMIMKTGDENVKLISNYNKSRDTKNDFNENTLYTNNQHNNIRNINCNVPSSRGASRKNWIVDVENGSSNGSALHSERKVISQLSSTKISQAKKYPVRDLPPMNEKVENIQIPKDSEYYEKQPQQNEVNEDAVEETTINDNEEKDEEIENQQDEENQKEEPDTTLGEAGLPARLEKMVDDLNGVEVE